MLADEFERPTWRVALVVAAIALASAGLLAMVGGAPFPGAYGDFWQGSFGSDFALQSLVAKTLPLLLVALGFAVALRAGLITIGLEGQLYVGALCSVVIATKVGIGSHVLHLALCVVAAALGGLLWSIVPIALKLWRDVSEIVTSLFLNYVAILLVNYLLSAPLKAENSVHAASETVPASARFPVLGDSGVTSAIVMALLLAVLVAFLFRTRLGYDMRVIGASPRVARYAGLPVKRVQFVAFLLSGALGGLAGAVVVLGDQFVLSHDFSAGWGYTGIAVAVLGAAIPLGIVLASFFFGVLAAGGSQLEFNSGVPPSFAGMTQALVLLLALAAIEVRKPLIARAAALSRRLRRQPDG